MTGNTKIIVVTYMDGGTKQRMVSHGINEDTLQTVILPPVPLNCIDVYFDTTLQEYVLK